ncbi:MAG: SH3 domain-containing protein [Pyrinomonadaceae bacterium]|nr:SH3 domain-containing protein [Pyrinomonadaceae bacterium]
MKQCPNCKTTYTDDSLQFCLSDGANLISASGEANTVQMSFGGSEPLRVNIPPDSAPTVFAVPPIIRNQPAKKGFGLIVAGLLGVSLLLFVGLIAAYLLLRPPANQSVVIAASPTPTASPNASPIATPNDETTRLKEEMANLKKQLENQKHQKQNPTVETFTPTANNDRTARAHSPGDGFLALRSQPSSETGYRIAKIPHGAALTVLGCPKSSNVGKMPGRWCQVNYNGQSGWAFDRFISF